MSTQYSSPCGESATLISVSFGSYCVSSVVNLSGILQVDIAKIYGNGGKVRRALTALEAADWASTAC